jgi:hypothetical protein
VEAVAVVVGDDSGDTPPLAATSWLSPVNVETPGPPRILLVVEDAMLLPEIGLGLGVSFDGEIDGGRLLKAGLDFVVPLCGELDDGGLFEAITFVVDTWRDVEVVGRAVVLELDRGVASLLCCPPALVDTTAGEELLVALVLLVVSLASPKEDCFVLDEGDTARLEMSSLTELCVVANPREDSFVLDESDPARLETTDLTGLCVVDLLKTNDVTSIVATGFCAPH